MFSTESPLLFLPSLPFSSRPPPPPPPSPPSPPSSSSSPLSSTFLQPTHFHHLHHSLKSSKISFLSTRPSKPPHPASPSPTKLSLTFNSPPSPDVLIIGGGIAGLSAAYNLAQYGLRTTIIDAHAKHVGAATGASAGMLAVNAEELRREGGAMEMAGRISRNMYSKWIEKIGGDVGYRIGEMVQVYYKERDDDNCDGGWIDGNLLKTMVPLLGDDVVGGFIHKGDGQVDVRKLWKRLREVCSKIGVKILDCEAEGVVLDALGERVEKVVVKNKNSGLFGIGDSVSAGHYLIAAGSWSSKVIPWLPVKPVKGQMIAVEWGGEGMERLLFGEEVYMVPKQVGERRILYIGATVEPNAGYDSEVTAGGVRYLLNSAIRMVPSVEETRLVESWAGLRPATPDGRPIVGQVLHNCSVCTGQYRNGILLAPLLGELAAKVAAKVPIQEEWQHIIDAFSVDRFFLSSEEPQTVSAPTKRRSKPVDSTRSYQETGSRTAPRQSSQDSDASDESYPYDPSEIKLWHVQPDGSKVPVKYKEPPAVFSVGYKDTTGEEEVDDGEIGMFDFDPSEYDDEYVASPTMSNIKINQVIQSVPGLERKEPKRQTLLKNELDVQPRSKKRPRSTNSTDAYDDILQHQGADAKRIMSEAFKANQDFGVTEEMRAAEQAAFDKAFEAGLKESEEVIRCMSNDRDPARLATEKEIRATAEIPTSESNGAVKGYY